MRTRSVSTAIPNRLLLYAHEAKPFQFDLPLVKRCDKNYLADE